MARGNSLNVLQYILPLGYDDTRQLVLCDHRAALSYFKLPWFDLYRSMHVWPVAQGIDDQALWDREERNARNARVLTNEGFREVVLPFQPATAKLSSNCKHPARVGYACTFPDS